MSAELLKAFAAEDKALAQARAAEAKVMANLKARAALRGVAIYLIDDDRGRDLYLAMHGVWQREFRTPAEVSSFLDLLEGRS